VDDERALEHSWMSSLRMSSLEKFLKATLEQFAKEPFLEGDKFMKQAIIIDKVREIHRTVIMNFGSQQEMDEVGL